MMSRHAATSDNSAVDIQFLTSNLSMPRQLMFTGSPEAYAEHLTQIHADGIELTPVRSRFVNTLAKRIKSYPLFTSFGPEDALPEPLTEQDEVMGQIIRSAHSPFRKDNEKGSLMSRPFYQMTKGLGVLARAQVLTGDLPAVVYGDLDNGKVVYSDKNAPFASRTTQPKPHEFATWGLNEGSAIEDIADAMTQRGITGFTYDVAHAQINEKDGKPFKDPVALAGRLAAAGLVEAIHLSVDRMDLTGIKPTKAMRATRRAGTAFATSALEASKTPEGEMMVAIGREWVTNPLYNDDTAPLRVVYEEGPYTQHDPFKQARIITHARELMDL